MTQITGLATALTILFLIPPTLLLVAAWLKLRGW